MPETIGPPPKIDTQYKEKGGGANAALLTRGIAAAKKCELFDNSARFPWLFFLFCGM